MSLMNRRRNRRPAITPISTRFLFGREAYPTLATCRDARRLLVLVTRFPTLWRMAAARTEERHNLPDTPKELSIQFDHTEKSRQTRDDSMIDAVSTHKNQYTFWRRYNSCTSVFPNLKESKKDQPDPWDDEIDFFETLDDSAWQLLDETSNNSISSSDPIEGVNVPCFQRASGKRIARPNAEAMKQAAKRLRLDEWDQPDTPSAKADTFSIPQQQGHFVPLTVVATPPRPRTPLAKPPMSRRSFRSPLRPITPQPKQISVGLNPRTYKSGLLTPQGRPPFISPFKKGVSATPSTSASHASPPMFILKAPEKRMSYKDAGIIPSSSRRPQASSHILRILQNPTQAAQYVFHGQHHILGPSEALEELERLGGSRLTLKWVRHHWSLILWKLAAYTYWRPDMHVWSFGECLRQLRYRYEREFVRKHKSTIKQIQEQLSSSARCMVLCVRQILFFDEDEGTSLMLELSDGWYCIRAEVDEPIRRAIQAGKLRVGHKLALMCAKLRSSGEPTAVLDALYTADLQLYANSTTLAPWDAKLGFCGGLFVSSLSRLLPDGGVVGRIDVVIERVYPTGYMEGTTDARGTVQFHGQPQYSAAEEAEREARWNEQYEAAKIQLNARVKRLNKAATWLETQVESAHEDKDMHAYIHAIEGHDDPSAILRDAPLSGVLYAVQERLHVLSQPSYEVLPPRHTRSFTIVRVREARPTRRESGRTVQLTVWKHEGTPLIKEGSRYEVCVLLLTCRSRISFLRSNGHGALVLMLRMHFCLRPAIHNGTSAALRECRPSTAVDASRVQ